MIYQNNIMRSPPKSRGGGGNGNGGLQMRLSYAPGQWTMAHLLVVRNPARVALSHAATASFGGSFYAFDGVSLRDVFRRTLAAARWTALRVFWHAAVLDARDSLVWFYEDLEDRPVESVRTRGSSLPLVEESSINCFQTCLF